MNSTKDLTLVESTMGMEYELFLKKLSKLKQSMKLHLGILIMPIGETILLSVGGITLEMQTLKELLNATAIGPLSTDTTSSPTCT